MKESPIPILDFTHFVSDSPEQRDTFVQQIGEAFRNVGFVSVVNHSISQDLIDNFYASSKEFFQLPLDQKLQYEMKHLDCQRGYTSFGTEHAKQSKVADLKEFFQIGQYADGDATLQAIYPENVNVEDVPLFSKYGKELYQAFEQTGSTLLQAIAIFLNLDRDYFKTRTAKGNSILRTIYYPPITQEPESAIRAEQHEDINLITLLVGASAGGLQILSKQNEWLDIQPTNHAIVINVGDMLQRLTNNYLRSTTHRVVNPPPKEWHTALGFLFLFSYTPKARFR